MLGEKQPLWRCAPACEICCSGWQMNRPWVAQSAVTIDLLAVRSASAAVTVGVFCTIKKRYLEWGRSVTLNGKCVVCLWDRTGHI